MSPERHRPPYRVQWLSQLHGAPATPEAVQALLGTLPHASLFNTPAWCHSAAGSLLASRQLQVLVLSDAGGLAAWLPLTVGLERVHGMPVRTLRMLGHPFNDRIALPMRGGADPHLPDAVLGALQACPAPWDVAILSELHDTAERRRLEAALASHPALAVQWRACSSSPVLPLSATAQALPRSASAAPRVARARRRLAAAGKVRFERLLPQPAQVATLVALCKSIEDRSWKGRQGLGIFSTPAGARFFADVAPRLAAQGWLDIGLLYLDERVVSYRLGFRYREVFYDFNLAYDPAWAACAPGRILLDEMIKSSSALGLVAVDASRSSRAEPHLLAEWSDARVEHHELWLFAPTWRGRLLGWARRHLRPWWRALRSPRPA